MVVCFLPHQPSIAMALSMSDQGMIISMPSVFLSHHAVTLKWFRQTTHRSIWMSPVFVLMITMEMYNLRVPSVRITANLQLEATALLVPVNTHSYLLELVPV